MIELTTLARGVAPGYIFYTPGNGAGVDGPTIVDDSGDLIWARGGSGRSVADFQVVRYQGRPALAWWEGAVNGGIGSGDFVLVDEAYREIGRIEAGGGGGADLHELRITTDGTALFFADAGVAPAGSPGVSYQVMDCAIREVDLASGRLIWTWHSVDHIALDESYVTPPTTTGQAFDYAHLNSIEVDRDGDLLVSARNTSTIYKVDRTTGEVVWRLGGKRSDFAMGDGAAFSWQHDARRQADGTVTLYDDSATPGRSRALVLELDETARTARRVRDFVHPTGLLSSSQGNAQVLPNGDVFVGWGSQPFFSEFAPDGTLLFDATFPAGVQSYRDLRAPWVGRPDDAPAVAVDSSPANGLTVYASWNGSTEVAGWDVLGGASAGSLRPLGSTARSGFETAIVIGERPTVLAVRAVDGDGALLGTSVPVIVPG
ncbi:MAG TPA: arylsulfotransferase family protein [Candidatus Limnocylindrales bacterium]